MNKPCHYVRGFDGEPVLIPGCWNRVHDERADCHCIQDDKLEMGGAIEFKDILESLQRIEKLLGKLAK